MVHPFVLPIALFSALGTTAMPTHHHGTRGQVSSVTAMSSDQLSALTPYTQFAKAAYCPPSLIQDWDCGEACKAVPDFHVSLAGGDGNAIQYYYVGHWSTLNTVVVAHQGTDPTQLLADITDAGFVMENLDPTLFPGVDCTVKVHSGWANEQAKTATIILDQVKSLISSSGATSVTLVGHSLGAALAELDCMFMALNLPSNIAIKCVTYGTPRIGNLAWATLFDATISDFQRINNKKDIIPIVPSRSTGYSHVMGEVHIVHPDEAFECPGNDDATDGQCTIKTVPNILEGNIADHFGPYQGILVGWTFCP